MSKVSSAVGGAPPNAAGSGSAGATSALRRIGDDPLLRPFLNSLFDPQAYVRTIIKDGKSEDCLASINDCTEKINDEIQRFISQNKDSLMSGMQDISSLAGRYHTLADHSKGLQTIVQRMKRETADSYNLIKARTSELDRIHDASTLLNHVKRFVKAKAQLDQYLKNPDDKDLRSLASAAKVVAELEKLLTIPNIQGIQLVQQNVATIKSFGSNIRMLAQTKLLEATAEKNQAAMAHYLQVFFNLDSLPEILLLTVDQTVRLAADASKDALQLDVLAGVFHDYVHKQGGTNAAGAPASATKRSVSTTALSTSTSATSAAQPVTLSQLRLAMREITHAWSTVIFERATQMLILQRVIAKKEDPLTHVKFRDVLREKAATVTTLTATSTTNSGGSGTETTTASVTLLANGQIVALFWQRLSNALHDICAEKLRHYPADVVCRLYPYLRRAAQDVLTQMQSWSDDVSNPTALLSSTATMAGGATSTLSFLNDGEWTIEQLLAMDVPASPFQQDLAALETLWANDNQVLGMFGSSMWHEDITRFRPNPATGIHSLAPVNGEEAASTKLLKGTGTVASSTALSTTATTAVTSSASSSSSVPSKEADLVQGLQPIRDRFLLAVLDRMQHPISQMFPDLDGYVAAIPSKRDLLTLIRAIQQEYVTVATESTDLSFIGLVNREFLKTVRLMLQKMEGMIISNGADVRRIATTASGSGAGAGATPGSHHSLATSSGVPSFVRTAPQDHNAQCFVLLGQLREALQKLPMQVIQHLDDPATATGLDGGNKDMGKTPMKTPSTVPDSSRKAFGGANEGGGGSTSSTTTGGSGSSIFVDNVLREITRATEQACAELDDLASRHIVEPMLSLLTEYSLTILSQLHRESVITSQGQSKTATGNKGGNDTMDLTIENSLAVQALVRQLPVLLKTYLFSLPKFAGSSLLDDAGEELANRLLMLYMSLASLSRPMTEAVRLRTAKDLSALEMLLSQQFPHVSSSQKHSPVMREFRAFRRLLFEEQLFTVAAGDVKPKNAPGGGSTTGKTTAVAVVPNRNRLLALEYVQDLRPSTLLGLLMAAGPSQLPLPPDLPGQQGKDIATYVLDLVQALAAASSASSSSASTQHSTVRNIYLPTPAMIAGHSHHHHHSAATTWTWKKIPVEKASWEMIQQCLDVFFQRLTVAEAAEQKQEMRAWYEVILDIGSHYFS